MITLNQSLTLFGIFIFIVSSKCQDIEFDIIASPVKMQNLVELAKESTVIVSLLEEVAVAEKWLLEVEQVLDLGTDVLADQHENPTEALRYLSLYGSSIPKHLGDAGTLGCSEFMMGDLESFLNHLPSENDAFNAAKGSSVCLNYMLFEFVIYVFLNI